jgi:hypothetical protein
MPSSPDARSSTKRCEMRVGLGFDAVIIFRVLAKNKD